MSSPAGHSMFKRRDEMGSEEGQRMNKIEDRGECLVSRRHLLKTTVLGGAVFVLSLAAEDTRAAPSWVQVGTAADFKPGIPKKVTLKSGLSVFVVRQQNNRWLAVSTKCTHSGGEVYWDTARKRFICPLHRATFGADGKSPTSPARSPLAQIPIQTTGKAVQLDAAQASVASQGRRGNGKKGEEEENEHSRGNSDGRRERREHHEDDDD